MKEEQGLSDAAAPVGAGSLREFLRGVWKDWTARMTGFASIVFTALGVSGMTSDRQRVVLYAAGAAFFVFAVFRVWLHERRARIATHVAHSEKLRLLESEGAMHVAELAHENAVRMAELERAAEEARGESGMKIVACPRCEKRVPKWFCGATLPHLSMSDRSLLLQRQKGIPLDEAQRLAYIRKAHFDEVGCLVCAGRSPLYPGDGETEAEFTARVLQPHLNSVFGRAEAEDGGGQILRAENRLERVRVADTDEDDASGATEERPRRGEAT